MKKRIFTYWHQGFFSAPPVVRMCAASLARHHPSWDLQFLDQYSIEDWLDPIPIPAEKWRKLPLAHQSDVIRTQLLINYGGVWTDPTVWFASSMDQWFSAQTKSGLFLFHRPGRDRLISNWFIAAEDGNALLARLYDELCEYWREHEFESIGVTRRKSINAISRVLNRNLLFPQFWLAEPAIRAFRHAPYMIYHYLFAWLVRTDAASERVWRTTPRVSSDAPVRLLRHGLLEPITVKVERDLLDPEPPFFKLTWKFDDDSVPEESVLAELFRREGMDPTGREFASGARGS